MGKSKELIDVVCGSANEVLERITYDLIGASKSSAEKRDGTIENRCVYQVEVPRGQGPYSRVRFSVKVLGTDLKVDPNLLDDYVVKAKFHGLEVYYINGKNVYVRANSVEIIEEGFDICG